MLSSAVGVEKELSLAENIAAGEITLILSSFLPFISALLLFYHSANRLSCLTFQLTSLISSLN